MKSLILCTALAVAGTVHAATITVTTNAIPNISPSQCGLIDAFESALFATSINGCQQGDASANVIQLQADEVYTLLQAYDNADPVISGPVGMPEISNFVTIEGNNATIQRGYNLSCVIDDIEDSNDFRIFAVNLDGGLIANDLTIANGCMDGAYLGAGMFNMGDLSLNNVAFLDNNANFDGAGLYAQSGSYSIGGGLFSNNTSSNGRGGGAYLTGQTVIVNSHFEGNSADDFGGGLAIGFQVFGDTANVVNSTFVENTAVGAGGAISGTDLQISESRFHGNTADSGGAVHTSGGQSQIEASVFIENIGTGKGGALFVEAATDIVGTTIANNTALVQGGGIFNASDDLTLLNSTLSGNLAQGHGGGVFATADLELTYVTLWNNRSDIVGHGVYLFDNPTFTATRSILGSTAVGATCDSSSGVFVSNAGYEDDGSCGGVPFGAPDLSPLGHYGGPTPVHMPYSFPIVDGIACDAIANDQRGFSRGDTGDCDLGAVENHNDVIFADKFSLSD